MYGKMATRQLKSGLPFLSRIAGRGNALFEAWIVVHRQGDLLEVVHALDAPGGLERRPHRGHHKSDQHAAVAGEVRVGIASRCVSMAPWRSTVNVVADGNSRRSRSPRQGTCPGRAA